MSSNVESLELSLIDGSVFKVTRELITNPQPLFDKVCRAPLVTVPVSSKVSYICDSHSGRGYLISSLDEIRFTTAWWSNLSHFKEGSELSLRPFVSDSTHDTFVSDDLTVTWEFTKPEMKPVFVATVNLSSDQVIEALGICYLFFVDADTGEFYAPPLPNVYDSGKLCTGSMPVDGTGLGVLEYMQQVLAQWSANTWNTDLYTLTKAKILRRVFRVDPVSLKVKPIPEADTYWFREYEVAGVVPGDSPAVQEKVLYEIRRIVCI